MSEFRPRIDGRTLDTPSIKPLSDNETSKAAETAKSDSQIKENIDSDGEFMSFEHNFVFGNDNFRILVSNNPMAEKNDRHRSPGISVTKLTADGKYVDSTNWVISEIWLNKSDVNEEAFKEKCREMTLQIAADLKKLIETEGTADKNAFIEVGKIVGQFRQKK